MDASEKRDRLVEIARNHSLETAERRLLKLSPTDWQLSVAFLGPFSSGKSTLVNALLGRPLLPAFVIPTNANVVEIIPAAEDRFAACTYREDGGVNEREVDLPELAREITTREDGKILRLQVVSQGIDLDRIRLVDTPGVNSLNETHDDVTYGYLPHVDIAFMVFDVTTGAPTKESLEFLEAFSPALLSRLVYVLNKTDTVNEATLAKRIESFRSVLDKVQASPRILATSGLEGLNARASGLKMKFDASGVGRLEEAIIGEAMQARSSIETARFESAVLAEAAALVALLQVKRSSVSFNTASLDASIDEILGEIEALHRYRDSLGIQIDQVERDTLLDVNLCVDEGSKAIAGALAEGENPSEALQAMIERIQVVLEEDIRTLGLPSQKLPQIDLPSVQILSSSKAIAEIGGLVANAGTFALTAWVFPGTTPKLDLGEALAAGGTVLASRGTSDKQGGTARGQGQLGSFVDSLGVLLKKINPVEKLKNLLLPIAIKPSAQGDLKRFINQKISRIFRIIRSDVNERIESEIEEPLREKEQLLNTIRSERKAGVQGANETIASIDMDLEAIASMQARRQ